MDATTGEVEVLGRRWGEHDNAIKNRIGISLQDTRLSEKLSARETLTLFRSFYGQGIEPSRAIALVSLEEKAEARVGKLSGGQKQRLGVACALVGDPELLFLDEPTTGLDPQSRRQLWDIIRGVRERGRTVLLTTHYMDEAERLCDRVAVIDHGKVIALGSPSELIRRLGGEHVIEFSVAGPEVDPGRFEDVAGVQATLKEGEHVRLTVDEPHVSLPALLERLRESNLQLAGLTTRHGSLEDVFVSLTGRHLRDDGDGDG